MSAANDESSREAATSSAGLCGTEGDIFDDYGDEPSCLVCGGEGMVDGGDHLDWDEDEYGEWIECTSCHGSGLAKDMTWC